MKHSNVTTSRATTKMFFFSSKNFHVDSGLCNLVGGTSFEWADLLNHLVVIFLIQDAKDMLIIPIPVYRNLFITTVRSSTFASHSNFVASKLCTGSSRMPVPGG